MFAYVDGMAVRWLDSRLDPLQVIAFLMHVGGTSRLSPLFGFVLEGRKLGTGQSRAVESVVTGLTRSSGWVTVFCW